VPKNKKASNDVNGWRDNESLQDQSGDAPVFDLWTSYVARGREQIAAFRVKQQSK